MTATIINMTSTGGEVGSSPKMNTRMESPMPPITPRPIPPIRAPTRMATRTKRNCNNIFSTENSIAAGRFARHTAANPRTVYKGTHLRPKAPKYSRNLSEKRSYIVPSLHPFNTVNHSTSPIIALHFMQSTILYKSAIMRFDVIMKSKFLSYNDQCVFR